VSGFCLVSLTPVIAEGTEPPPVDARQRFLCDAYYVMGKPDRALEQLHRSIAKGDKELYPKVTFPPTLAAAVSDPNQ
jgi:hypothetical protein